MNGGIEIIQRCGWARKSPRLLKYHDTEWGVPEFNERKLFEAFSLEIIQAGLRWDLILKKRSAIRHAFKNFEDRRVAKLDLRQLLRNHLIIRNRLKLAAIIHNARQLIQLHRCGSSLKQLTWQPVHYVQLDHFLHYSDKLDNTRFIRRFLVPLRIHGFERSGPKTVYSYLQAVGVVNDHLVNCFRHRQINEKMGEIK